MLDASVWLSRLDPATRSIASENRLNISISIFSRPENLDSIRLGSHRAASWALANEPHTKTRLNFQIDTCPPQATPIPTNLRFLEKQTKTKKPNQNSLLILIPTSIFIIIIMSRLIHSRFSVSKSNNVIAIGRNGRFMCSDSNRTDEPFKVDTSRIEEAETVNIPPPPTEKLLVLGGNGFVGSHVCKEAVNRGLTVASLSRRGRQSIQEPWSNTVQWHQGNLLSTDSWKEALKGVTSIISCIGGFGSNADMYKINGTANINAIRAAAEEGVKRFVYISAADFGVVNYLLQGYYEGKRAAETELFSRYPYGGVILRPGFIHGTRQVGSMKLPLSVIGSPLEMVLQHAKPLSQVPFVGPLFTPPVNVTAVAKVAVRAATDIVFPPGIVDVHGILRYSQQR